MPAGEVASSTNPQRFYVPKENDSVPPPATRIVRRESIVKEIKESITPTIPITKNKNEALTNCDVCQGEGTNANLVR